MGFGSIWHWLIVAWLIGIVLMPFKLASSTKFLGRQQYLIRLAGLFGASLLIGMLSLAIWGQMGGVAAQVIWGSIGTSFVLYWSIHRTQDVGWSRWLALLVLVPGVNFAWMIALCAIPAVAHDSAN
jgi:hypothetical protein